MQTIQRKSIRQFSLLFAGLFMLGNGLIATLRTNLHAGIWFTYGLGAILLVWGALLRWLPRWIHAVLTAGLTFAILCVAGLYLYGGISTVDYQEDAVIVLGTGVRGTELSDSLRSRLDCAADYHRRNPAAIIAVSGGQGPQEDIPEGEAMAAYLLEQGIPAEKILRETVSSNTAENFRMTRALLDEHFSGDYRIACISNHFHLLRAGWIAADCGYPDAAHIGAPTPWYMLIPNGLRECAAIVKYWLGL